MALNIITASETLQRGLKLIGYNAEVQAKVKAKTNIRRFKRHYGSTPKALSVLWEDLQTTQVPEARLDSTKNQNSDKAFGFFLMFMYYMKGYPLEEVLASRFGVHEQTARKWVDFFAKKVSALISEKVVWPDTWETIFIVSIDCVNFGTNEPRHPTLHKDKRFFDRKGGKAGLSYEIALHLFENRVVWFNGPFPPNAGTDKTIYKTKGLMQKIPDGKKGIADKIYMGCNKISLHNSLDTPDVREFKARARARQESINARLKSFGILKQRFRHGVSKHKVFCSAAMVICIYQMENGSPLFNV